MSFWLEVFASFLLVMGGLFILIGALGMVKLPDFYPVRRFKPSTCPRSCSSIR